MRVLCVCVRGVGSFWGYKGSYKVLRACFIHQMNLHLSTNAYNQNGNTLSHGYRQLLYDLG